MRNAVVLGTGGHARVILSLITSLNAHKLLALVELGVKRDGESIPGVPLIADISFLGCLAEKDETDIFLAIGNNELRSLWWRQVRNLGFCMPNLISPDALVDGTVVLGESNVICPRAFVGPHAKVGNNNLINTSAIVEHEVYIGDNCHMAPSSTIAGRCRLDDYCLLGVGATIINGVSVAKRSIIGAGATLVTNIEQPGGIYIGTPARKRQDER